MTSIGTLTASLQLQSAAFIRDLGRAQRAVASNTAAMNKSMREVERATRNVERQMGSFRKVVVSAGAALAAFGAAAVVRDIVKTSAEFQRLQSSLKTVTGSAAAAEMAFAQIKQFAATTPYDLAQVTDGFIKLKALGLDPSMAALQSYGNTASAMGKQLNQFIEAVADAATGEFERLKEFGIKAKSQGDEVSFVFQGVSTTVRKNAADIEKYLRGIGQVQFAGAMEEQAKTLGGALSNLGDAFSVFQNEIGEGGVSSAIADLSREMADAANGSHNLAREIGAGLGDAIRAMGDAARFAAQNMREITAAVAAFLSYKVAGAFLNVAGAIVQYTKSVRAAALAMGALNAVIRTSPLGLFATVIGVGVGALIEFSGSKDDATKAAERHTKALGDETRALDGQVARLREAQKAALERQAQLSESRAAALKQIKEMQDAGALGQIDAGSSIDINGTEISGFELMTRDLAEAIALEEQAASRAREQLAKLAAETANASKSAQDSVEWTDKKAKAFRSLEESLLPVAKAQREYEEGVKLLDEAIQAGQISFMQYNLLLESLAMNLDEATNKTSELEKAQRKAAEALTEANKTNDQLAAETQAIMDGAKAWESYKQAREITDNTDALRKDLEAAGVAADQIERVVAQRQFLLETQGEALKKMQEEQALYSELESIGSRAFDRIGSSITQMFVEGKSSAVSFKSVMLGVVSEIMQSFIQLAAINPLKNALFGTSAATLSSAGGGLFGSLFGAGYDTSMSSSLVQTGGSGVIGRTYVGPFADGGSFTVGSGNQSVLAGRDNRLISFAARDGERVTVETPGQQRMKSGEASGNSGTTVNMTLNNPTRDMIPDIIQQLQAIGMRVNQVDRSVEGRSIRAVSDAQRRGNSAMRSAFG